MIQFAKPIFNTDDISMSEIYDIIKSGWVCEGKYCLQLEEYFKARFNVKYAIACCNATQGLVVAFKAAGIQNMNVAIPAFTWPSTLYALKCSNNNPIFCDIDPETWTINFIDTYYIDAVIPVDTFGARSFAYTNKPVIYDAAHSFNTDNIGNRGIAEVISLSFTKPVTAMQGGVILTNDTSFYEEASEIVKLTSKMCEINAYVCLKNIKSFSKNLEVKHDIVATYKSLLKVPFTVQKVNDFSTFMIVLEDLAKRDRVVENLNKEGFETKVYYKPLTTGLPNTDTLYSRILGLPIYNDIHKHIIKICDIINEA